MKLPPFSIFYFEPEVFHRFLVEIIDRNGVIGSAELSDVDIDGQAEPVGAPLKYLYPLP